MGKKINPKIFRLNTIGECSSKWFAAKKDFAETLKTDQLIRKYVKTKFKASGISKLEIKRSAGNIELIMFTSKPGVIIGRGGAGVEDFKKDIKRKYFGSKKVKIIITITEVRKPDVDAELILQGMIAQLEKRVPFRKVLKKTIEQVKRAGAKGVKVIASGRLNGAEIARTEALADGKIPTHTLRADIDYSRGTARTIYGAIGIKVWIYKGDIFSKDMQKKMLVGSKDAEAQKTEIEKNENNKPARRGRKPATNTNK